MNLVQIMACCLTFRHLIIFVKEILFNISAWKLYILLNMSPISKYISGWQFMRFCTKAVLNPPTECHHLNIWQAAYCRLTHCGPVKPHVGTEIGQQWLRQWLIAWRHQAITWNNVDWSSVQPSYIHLFKLDIQLDKYGVLVLHQSRYFISNCCCDANMVKFLHLCLLYMKIK